jgi:2-polyprenyl-3-methyl-5-hydroxy-6-metoxy-1,4-benzoquinol methylase
VLDGPPSPAGNTYDKYGTRNPVARQLVASFRAALTTLVDRAAPRSLIDVGCGEGVLTSVLAERLGGRHVLGVDRNDPGLRAEWASRPRPNVEYRVADAESLPIADGEYDLACAIEVLEHVSDPEAALGELRRVARRGLIVSVPREPIWRMANVARGAHLRSLGDTPGHRHHWSKRGFASLVSRYGRIDAVRSPFPWTIASVRLDRG